MRGVAVALSGVLLVCACSRGGEHELPDGARLYQENCSTCHGLDGAGSPRVYPPLAGHVPSLVAAYGGREYLVRVPLSGLSGPIVIDSDRYDGIMAPFGFRSDAELAAILNYIATAWGNDRLLPPSHVAFTSAEVASGRGEGRSGADVRGMRPPHVSPRKESGD